MMSCIRSMTGILLVLMLSAFLYAAGTAEEDELHPGLSLEEAVPIMTKRTERLMDLYDIPGAAAALIQNGSIVWTGTYGYADRERNIPVTQNTPFRIESMTKTCTAWLIAGLAESGRIELEDPVTPLLTRWEFPESEFPEEEVTVERLLSHSAGITGERDYHIPGKRRPPVEKVLEGESHLEKAAVIREPGSAFEYSNQGFVLLELIVEEITGADFAQYMQDELLAELGIEHASFYREKLESEPAVSYDMDGQAVPFYLNPFRGAAGLSMNIEDAARFYAAAMHASEKKPTGRGVLSPETVRLLHTPVIEPAGMYAVGADGSALGLFSEQLPDGQTGFFHGGEGSGSLGIAYYVPEKGEGIVILTNSKRSWLFLSGMLNNWAAWVGTGTPSQSSFLLTAVRFLRILGISLTVVSISSVLLILRSRKKGRRRILWKHPEIRKKPFLLIGAAVLLPLFRHFFGVFIIRNLLPVHYDRLLFPVLSVSLALILSALFPVRKDVLRENRKAAEGRN